VTQWMPVRLHHSASDVAARVVLLGDTPIAPGGEAFVQLVLERPIAAAAQDRFVLRDTTAQRTIAGGRFLDLRAPARKRRAPERLAQLDAHKIEDPQAALAALLDRAPRHVDLAAFARDRALGVSDVDAWVAHDAVIRIAGTALGLAPATWLRLRRTLVATLAAFHQRNPDLAGMGRERLRLQLEPRLPALAFTAMLQGLVRTREIALDGAWVRLPGHAVQLAAADEKLWGRIRPRLAAERFRPPRVRDIAAALAVKESDVRRLLKLLGRIGQADEIAPDHFFLRATVAEMAAIAADVAAHADRNEFSAAQFRDRLDNGRKVAIQILEFFDRHGVTLRRGDLRRINPHRLDLFGAVAQETGKGREASPVGRPDFKSGRGREPVLGGFDSLSLPPDSSAR
jgi:selenocysteine-specific elongation factor